MTIFLFGWEIFLRFLTLLYLRLELFVHLPLLCCRLLALQPVRRTSSGATWSQFQGRNRIPFWIGLVVFCFVTTTSHFDWGEGCAASMGSMKTAAALKKMEMSRNGSPDQIAMPNYHANAVSKGPNYVFIDLDSPGIRDDS